MDTLLRKKNKKLFHKLIAYGKRNLYNDDYLKMLIEFWQLPENEIEGDILYARYALAHGSYTVAIEYGEKAFSKRKINWELWCILRDAYYAIGEVEKALLFAAFADKFYKEPVLLDIPKSRLENALDIFSLGMGDGIYAPVAFYRMKMGADGVKPVCSLFAGEFLPEIESEGKYRTFAAAYTEVELQDDKGRLMEHIKEVPAMSNISGADMTYDLIKVANMGKKCSIPVDDTNVVVGLVGNCVHQQVNFRGRKEESLSYLGKWGTTFFRLDETTEISSSDNILCTAPVVLKHSSQRCKVVLNILLDGMCWRAIQENNYELVPNILRFFKKGVIFSNHYSVSEYTYPSLATIETGLYPYNSQIFNPKASHSLNREYITLSERMHNLGYYCVNIMGDSAGSYNGIMRGYDRMIVNCCGGNPIYIGMERTLNHLDAFSETDQFIFLHVADTHLWTAHNYQLPLSTQTKLTLRERSLKEEEKKTSVYLPQRAMYIHWNEQGIKNCDAHLARLFDYLEKNYNEDEFLISVYSDHGSPIYDKKNYVLSYHHNSASFMMRGRNVPELGFVDELTSAVDIYPTLGNCLGFSYSNIDGNLPAAFGGQSREYVVSMSVYPRSIFMMCIRTQDYECRAESVEILDEDGRVDLTDMKVSIYKRDSWEEVHDESVKEYFRSILDRETRMIDNYGTQWPAMRAARPEWFDEREKNGKHK